MAKNVDNIRQWVYTIIVIKEEVKRYEKQKAI